MGGKRQERQHQRRREELERALDRLEHGDGHADLAPVRVDELFFHDHGDLVSGLAEVLERSGLAEAFQALARHLEEDREHWLRRLAAMAAEPALRARRQELDRDYQALLAAHFRRWGAAGIQGERTAELEAALTLAALRGAERLWLQGGGRPVLPVLVQEALALLWPSIYGHARRHM
jgi:AcrR family transcriptional regulator